MNKNLMVLHIAYAALVVACVIVAAIPQVHAIPMVGETLVGVAAWAWGKMGFRPSKALLAQILQRMPNDEIATLTNRPPPPLPTVIANSVIVTPVKSDDKTPTI